MFGRVRIQTAVLLLLMTFGQNAGAREELSLSSEDDTEFSVIRYPAKGEYLLLWIAPEYGFHDAHHELAEKLAQRHVEAWQINLLEALFMPLSATSQRKLDGRYVAELVEQAHRMTGKTIVIVGDSYAAMTALLGAREWQRRAHPERYLAGAVLFTPYSYAVIPTLGRAPEFMPIVSSTNIPMMIYQSQNSGTTVSFDELLSRLRRNGSPIYTRILPNIMGLFYQEPPTEAMQKGANAVVDSLPRVLPLLAQHGIPEKPVPLTRSDAAGSGIDVELKEYHGDIRPVPIMLEDISGHTVTRDNFTNRVTLINFWATWCPPCVEEIPSLNRLKTKMQSEAFELISINYAEDAHSIKEFMRKVEVAFPVLLDRDGAYARQWKVISFPSTFVLDGSGTIRYGVNAAIIWDDPLVIEKLKSLAR